MHFVRMLSKTKTLRHTVIIFLLSLGLLVFTPTIVGANDLQNRITQLNQEISENQAQLDALEQQANTLENKLATINAEMAQLTSQISRTQLQIEQLQQQLKETEEKLAKKKAILFENAKALYKNGDISTIEILASSDNFSEFINKQEYSERVKDALNKATREVMELKTQLENQKKSAEELLASLKGQEQILASKQAEQQRLLDQTRGEEARYQEMVSNLTQQRNRAEQELLSQLRSGSLRGGDGSGTAARPGQVVTRGQLVGFVGDSGFAEGPHLHFALIEGGSYADPVESYSAPKLKYGMQWPVPSSTTITQPYGCVANQWYSQAHCPPGQSFHRGVDIGAGYGERVVAAEVGVVTYAGCWAGSGFGNIVIIDHQNGRQTYYPHLGSGCH